MRVQFALLSFLFPVIALAGLNEDFEALRDSAEKYDIVGTVCEQVAKLRTQEAFTAPQYTVVTGIAYGDGNRTIGELDVVVFDNNTHKAVQVAEVKCWKKMNEGLSKAKDQRQRFLKNINSSKTLYFESTGRDHEKYDQDQFEGVKKFISIAQLSSESVGFDYELEYSLEELMGLRGKLMKCQDRGECARP